MGSGRPRTPIGTHGAVNTRREGRRVVAETRVRDLDGRLRQVRATGGTAAAARTLWAANLCSDSLAQANPIALASFHRERQPADRIPATPATRGSAVAGVACTTSAGQIVLAGEDIRRRGLEEVSPQVLTVTAVSLDYRLSSRCL